MKKSFWILAVAALTLFAACGKYDDSAIRADVADLKAKVEAIESTLNQTVSNLQKLSEKVSNQLTVTGVAETDDAYVISFSDNSKVTISKGKDGVTPVIGIKEVDNVYFWTVNGDVVKDADGNPIPVASAGPLFRAGEEEGTIEYSVDGGATWQPVAASSDAVTVEETESSVIITFGESSIVLPKEVPFTLGFKVPSTLIIPFGETVSIAYTVAGVGAEEAVEVDVLNNGHGFTAQVEASAGDAGTIAITNNTNAAAESIKVFVYATNHTGKADIKALVFKTEQGDEPLVIAFEAVLDAKLFPAEGGDYTLNVSADEDYNVAVDADWITVTPITRALYEEALPVHVEANETTAQRSATITISSKESDKVITIPVLQEAGEVPPVIEDGYDLFLGAWNDGNGILNIDAFSYTDEETGDVYDNVIYELSYGPFNDFINSMFGVTGYEFPFMAGYAEYEEIPFIYFMCVDVMQLTENEVLFFAAIDDGDYIEYGGADMDIMLAGGAFNEDGSFTIVGNEYDAVYNGKTWHEKNVALSMFLSLLEDEDGYEAGDYMLRGMPTIDLPATFTKESLIATVQSAKSSIEQGKAELVPVRSRMAHRSHNNTVRRFVK